MPVSTQVSARSAADAKKMRLAARGGDRGKGSQTAAERSFEVVRTKELALRQAIEGRRRQTTGTGCLLEGASEV